MIFLVLIVLLSTQHVSEAVECAIPNVQKSRIFNSLVEYQGNKDSFDPVTSHWLGSTVEFNNTIIKTLQRNSFVTFDSQHIVNLFLTGKKIQEVNDGAFLQLDCLHELRLNHNNITKLSKNAFQGLSHLQLLDLSDNHLEELPDMLFINVQRLVELNLSKNQIGLIQSLAFQKLEQLKVLNLEQNRLNTLPDQVFAPTYSLQMLSLAWNKLKDIEPERWYGLKKLESLNLAGNGLNHFDPNYNFSFTSLKTLNLSSNFLTILNVAALRKHLPNLVLIDINNNSWVCDDLDVVIQNLKILKIRVFVEAIACSESPVVSTRITEGSASTTTELAIKYYIDSIVEKKVEESSEEIKDSVEKLHNLVICLFVILGVFVIFELFVRTGCCMVFIKRFRGDAEYFDSSNVENFRLLNR